MAKNAHVPENVNISSVKYDNRLLLAHVYVNPCK